MSGKVFHEEDYKIFDRLAKSKQPGPKGWALIYMKKKLEFEGPNLVVAQGREFVAQKIFGLYSTESSTRTNLTSHEITHFAIGGGGSEIESDSVTLVGPEIGDSGLYRPIGLGDSSYLDEPSSIEEGSLHTYENAVKSISTDGQRFLESVSYEGTSDWYTKVKCECVIPSGEPSQLDSDDSVKIDEAGLYLVDGSNVKMFSHICFPPKWKEKESDFEIHWYILC
ncbi:MAG: hypothetical protein ACOC80_12775 [Petrotogales bacterium]